MQDQWFIPRVFRRTDIQNFFHLCYGNRCKILYGSKDAQRFFRQDCNSFFSVRRTGLGSNPS